MNKIIAFAALAMAALAAQAQEQGRVLSATPITEQIAIPQQVCGNETIYSGPRPTTGAGALMGAIAGGAAGNAIGSGGGRAAATALGLFGGAVLGNQIEGGRPGYQNVQRCTTETYYDSRVVGYDVVYEYAGRHYSTRTPTDPGPWIALTVRPAAQGPQGYQSPSTPYQPGYQPGYPSNYPSSNYPSAYPSNAPPGVVVSTQPGPAAYVVEPPVTVIEYRDAYGYPYRPPRHSDRHWR